MPIDLSPKKIKHGLDADSIKARKPSGDVIKEKLMSIDPHGTISAGYEYGILPFVVAELPSGGFRTEGRVSFMALDVPLEFTFFYTSIKNTIGLNNYFKLSYCAPRYKEQLSKKLNSQAMMNADSLAKLQAGQQRTLQKIEYLKFVRENPYNHSPGYDIPADSIPAYPGYDKPGFDTTRNTQGALSRPSRDFYKNDSIAGELEHYTRHYDSVNKVIAVLRKEIALLKAAESEPQEYSRPYASKKDKLLSRIKKFEIGLCNPSYSTFLVNNVPLQGVSVEYLNDNKFLGISYGTTVNNMLYDPGSLQGIVQGARNLYNYFDFDNLSSGRKVLVAKGGPGTLENSHLHIGFEMGKGRSGYIYTSPESSASGAKESNLVLELDARYKFSEQLSADLVIGKSSVREGDLSTSQVGSAFNEITSAYRSYAMLSRISFKIRKTGTKLTGTLRWIDPFFKSFGVGFLRSDNVRYELKADQVINKRIRYAITYRHESDNLLNLYTYKNTLQSINNMLNVKLSRKLNIQVNYTPLFRELKSEELTIKDRNHIASAMITYSPRFKRSNAQFSAIYCRNIITADSINIDFQNITYSQQVQLNQNISSNVNLSWFQNNLSDTAGDVYLAAAVLSYKTAQKSRFSIGGKVALNKGTEMQYGFIAKADIRLYKELYWETEAEKIIIGEYYSSFMIGQMKKFPYYCNTKFILNF
ncbi:MAG: hypothetical protein JWO09_2749 [Bacteroidetes bacterium]|nr:hypothetical protein [Bacteroidota bacterium]